jgi:hypothetical protein
MIAPLPPKVDRSDLARREWRAARLAALPPQLLVLREVLEDRGLLDGWALSRADKYDPHHLLRLAAAQGGTLERLAINLYEQLETEWFGEFFPEQLIEGLEEQRPPARCRRPDCVPCRYEGPRRALTDEGIEFAIAFHLENVRAFEALPQQREVLALKQAWDRQEPEVWTVAVPVGASGDRDYLALGGRLASRAYRVARGDSVGHDEVRGLVRRWGLASYVRWTRQRYTPAAMGRAVLAWRKAVEHAGWRWQKGPYFWTMACIPWRTL